MADVFTSRDMDDVLGSGGFAGLDAGTSFDAIRRAVDNPVDDAGAPVARGDFDRDAATSYLLSRYADDSLVRLVSRADGVARRKAASAGDAVSAAVRSVTGVSPREYALARMSRDAGDPSDLLRIYSKFIERC